MIQTNNENIVLQNDEHCADLRKAAHGTNPGTAI